MKNILIALIITISLVACNNQNKVNLTDLKQVEIKLDSAHKFFQTLQIVEFYQLKSEMDSTLMFVKDHEDVLAKIDANYINYFGPYSSSAKAISRVFKKRIKEIETNLKLADKQIEDLKYDLKNNLITDSDSIKHFIAQEQNAVFIVIDEIKAIEKIMNQQKKAYEFTHEKVDSLVEMAKQKIY